jgi:hypothetical protein
VAQLPGRGPAQPGAQPALCGGDHSGPRHRHGRGHADRALRPRRVQLRPVRAGRAAGLSGVRDDPDRRVEPHRVGSDPDGPGSAAEARLPADPVCGAAGPRLFPTHRSAWGNHSGGTEPLLGRSGLLPRDAASDPGRRSGQRARRAGRGGDHPGHRAEVFRARCAGGRDPADRPPAHAGDRGAEGPALQHPPDRRHHRLGPGPAEHDLPVRADQRAQLKCAVDLFPASAGGLGRQPGARPERIHGSPTAAGRPAEPDPADPAHGAAPPDPPAALDPGGVRRQARLGPCDHRRHRRGGRADRAGGGDQFRDPDDRARHPAGGGGWRAQGGRRHPSRPDRPVHGRGLPLCADRDGAGDGPGRAADARLQRLPAAQYRLRLPARPSAGRSDPGRAHRHHGPGGRLSGPGPC